MVNIEIELSWAKKFRELLDTEKSDADIIMAFAKYCDEEEQRIAKEYSEYIKNLKSYSELELVK